MLAYIHIGCEKTGTTSVQAFLKANAKVIETAGWFLPRSGHFPNATKLALSCVDRAKNYPDLQQFEQHNTQSDWRDDVWATLKDELTGTAAERVILSSEFFQAKLKSEDEVRLLRQRLCSVGFTDFRIIVYLRRQLEYAISRYSTALRAGYSRRGVLPKNAGEGIELYDYERLLSRWCAVFGRQAIDVRIYHPAQLENGNVVDDFAQALCLPKDLAYLRLPDRLNTGLPMLVQLVIRALNEALESKGVTRSASMDIRRTVLSRLLDSTSGESLAPSRDAAIAFQSGFAASNERIAQSWFSGAPLFDDEFDYPEQALDVQALEYIASLFAHSIVDELNL